MARTLAVILTCWLFATPALAAGLFTPDTGIRALGRAGAFTALADDNMALYYNPAGLWQINGVQLQGGLLGQYHPSSFLREGGEGRYKLDDTGAIIVDGNGDPVLDGPYEEVHNLDKFRPIPEGALMIGLEKPDMTFALGLYAPLAPWLTYPTYGANRYRMTRLRMVQGNLTLGWGWRLPQQMDWLAIGATFQLIYVSMAQDFWATADLEAIGDNNNPEHPQYDVYTQFEAEQYLPSWNAGLMIMPNDFLRIGIGFAPPYKFDGKGSVTLSGQMAGDYLQGMKDEYGAILELMGVDLDTSPMQLTGLDDDIMVHTIQPAILRAGVMVQPTPWLNLELDGQIEFWSIADEVLADGISVPLEHCDEDGCQPLVEELQGRLENETIELDPCESIPGISDDPLVDCSTLDYYEGSDGSGTHTIAQNYKNAFSIRFGGEIQPLPGKLGIRFGYAFESSAAPDSSISLTMIDNPKHLIGLGVSGYINGFDVHFTYAHMFMHERTVGLDVSTEMQTGLQGTAVNQIDAGTYNAQNIFLGLNLSWNFTTFHQNTKRKKAAAAEQRLIHL